MNGRRIAALVAAGAVAAGGTGVAVAATRRDDAKAREQAVLADAAKRLGTDATSCATRSPARRTTSSTPT